MGEVRLDDENQAEWGSKDGQTTKFYFLEGFRGKSLPVVVYIWYYYRELEVILEMSAYGFRAIQGEQRWVS